MSALAQFLDRDRNYMLALAAVFFVLVGPSAFHYLFYFPDEVFYTDGAAFMLLHGDYITPYEADGLLRFKKPIFTYWAVVLSYHIFGISQWSSRLPFMIGGLVSAWFVYRAARLWLSSHSIIDGDKSREVALIAFPITLINLYVLMASTQSLTDIYLLMWIACYVWGFIGIWSTADYSPRYTWICYLGGGMAVMAKGIPALVFFGLIWLFFLVNPWRRVSIRRLWNTPAIITGLVLGLWWYVAVYLLHGDRAMQVFFNDQLGERMDPNILLNLGNFLVCLSGLVWLFLPWSAIAASRSSITDSSKGESASTASIADRRSRDLALWWLTAIVAGVMILTASFVYKLYVRYLLPMYPLVILCYVQLWARSAPSWRMRVLRRTISVLSIVLSILFLLICIHIYIVRSWHWHIVLSLVMAVVIPIAWRKMQHEQWRTGSMHVSALVCAGFLAFFLAVVPLSLPGHGKQLYSELQRLDLVDADLTVYHHKKVSSRLRVASGGRVDEIVQPYPSSAAGQADLMIYHGRDASKLDLRGYDTIGESRIWDSPPYADMVRYRLDGKDPLELQQQSDNVWYIVRRR